jgi:hypothetical protein
MIVTEFELRERELIAEAMHHYNQREREYEYRRDDRCTVLLVVGIGLICVTLLLFGGF